MASYDPIESTSSRPTTTNMAQPLRRESGLAAKRGTLGAIARFWKRTYAPDYVSLVLLSIAYLLLAYLATPFHRMFALDDINLQYPHAAVERVPVFWNIVYAGVIPFFVILSWLAVDRASGNKFQVTLLGFFIALMLSATITDVIKNSVGRPRPDLISRCKAAPGTPTNQLVQWTVCTETDPHTLQDGWRSFPSGHSNFAFAGLGYTSLFFAGQLHVFRPRNDLSKALFTFCPLLGAAMIAISRCEDYRHDVYDVTCGSILGFAVAYFSYRRYYPELRSSRCDKPYASKEMEDERFTKLRDDEEAQRRTRDYSLRGADSSEEER